jgi:hypothetical protein
MEEVMMYYPVYYIRHMDMCCEIVVKKFMGTIKAVDDQAAADILDAFCRSYEWDVHIPEFTQFWPKYDKAPRVYPARTEHNSLVSRLGIGGGTDSTFAILVHPVTNKIIGSWGGACIWPTEYDADGNKISERGSRPSSFKRWEDTDFNAWQTAKDCPLEGDYFCGEETDGHWATMDAPPYIGAITTND